MSAQASRLAYRTAPGWAAKNPDNEAVDGLLLDRGKIHAPLGSTLTVNKPRIELYTFWRNFANLQRFMRHVRSVQVLDALSSRWSATAPDGSLLQWDAIVSDESDYQMIAWSSAADSTVRHSGMVDFKDSTVGRGTEVTLALLYEPPAQSLGMRIAKLCSDQSTDIARQELRRFKQLMETGEVSTAQRSPMLMDVPAGDSRGTW
jgi:uncharacterized membrane protein